MYHYVRALPSKAVDPIGYGLSVPPAVFAQQMSAFSKAGFHTETMADVAVGKGGLKSVALTFDDGYEDFYTTAYPILRQNDFTATIYIITAKVGTPNYMTWEQLQELVKAGIEVGAHTVNHIDLATASRAQQEFEIKQSKQILEEHLGIPVTAFCYPSGKYTATTEDLVRQAGFTTATTTQPGIVHPGADALTLPRIRVDPSTTLADLTDGVPTPLPRRRSTTTP